jgi:release factor glutamine methyltransferase
VSNTITHSVATLSEELQLLLGHSSSKQANEIIATLLDVPRFWPTTHAADPVDDAICEAACTAVTQLQRGAPFAYAVQRAAFRHLTLHVDERVLIPRPETELLVDLVLSLAPRTTGTIVDIGTGSGAIALALASEANFSRVIATDISLDALTVAQHNASSLAAKGVLRTPVEFRHGSLVTPVKDIHATAIVSNPPYITFEERVTLPSSVVDWEPALALFSDNNGMAATAEIVRDAADVLEPEGILALEVDSQRASLTVAVLAADPRYEGIAVHLDLTQRERFVVARRRPS